MTSTPVTSPTHAPAEDAPPARALQAPVAIDAGASGLFGLGLLLGAPSLAELTGMGVGWLRGIGVFAVVYAGELTYLSFRLRATTARRRRGRPSNGGRLVRMVGVGNLGWVVASAVVTVAVDLTAAGLAIVGAQALLVLALAVWQLRVGRQTARSRTDSLSL